MFVGITMQQPIREAISPHGASGELNIMANHHHLRHSENIVGVDSTIKAVNHDSTLYDSQIPGHEHVLGGVGMPPQQVYVNQAGHGSMVGPVGMNSLESQFQALGFAQHQEEASSTEPSSSQSNTNNAEEDHDEEDGEEEEPIKLFVGQVRADIKKNSDEI
jgi:hypothetical protein